MHVTMNIISSFKYPMPSSFAFVLIPAIDCSSLRPLALNWQLDSPTLVKRLNSDNRYKSEWILNRGPIRGRTKTNFFHQLLLFYAHIFL